MTPTILSLNPAALVKTNQVNNFLSEVSFMGQNKSELVLNRKALAGAEVIIMKLI